MKFSNSVTGLRIPEHLVNSIRKCCEAVETVERKGELLKVFTLIVCSIYYTMALISFTTTTNREGSDVVGRID